MKEQLEKYYNINNNSDNLTMDNPDPIMVARKYNDEFIALICALFSYGNAKLIVKFLNSIDFDILNLSDDEIIKSLSKHYYRFQSTKDVADIMISMKRLKNIDSLQDIFFRGYKKNEEIIYGLEEIIKEIYKISKSESRGFRFLVGKVPNFKKNMSAYKRWNLFLRWVVRDDNIDLGLWDKVHTKDLIIPLDTHIHKAGIYFNLSTRKTADFLSAKEISKSLKKFNNNDPIKYDFALYRLFQNKELTL